MCVCYLKETKACVHQIKLEQKTRMFILYKNIKEEKLWNASNLFNKTMTSEKLELSSAKLRSIEFGLVEVIFE